MPSCPLAYVRPKQSPTVLVGVSHRCYPLSSPSTRFLWGSGAWRVALGSGPGFPEPLGSILRGCFIDVYTPDMTETLGRGCDLDMPMIVVGDRRPFRRQDLGRLVGCRVESHLEARVVLGACQRPEVAPQQSREIRGGLGVEDLLERARVAAR